MTEALLIGWAVLVLVLVVCLLYAGMTGKGDGFICPRCGCDTTTPDHATGCNKCDACGAWFPVPYEEQ